LESLRRGELEYTKARSISKVKDEHHRQLLLTQAVQNQFSLNEIRAKVRQLSAQVSAQISNSPLPNNDSQNGDPFSNLINHSVEQTLAEGIRLKNRFSRVSSRLKKSTVWSDPNQQEYIDSLLRKLEDLTE